MEYLTTTEAAERWGITPRHVQVLCKSGRIEGAVYKGVWLIPAEEGGDLYLINGNISTLICLDKAERSHVECVVLMLRKNT